METCQICKKEFTMFNVQRHIRGSHKLSDALIKEYYDMHYKRSNEGICPISGKATRFLGIARGYTKYHDSPEVLRVSLSTNSIEYLMKVKGLTQEEATHQRLIINQRNSQSVHSTFKKKSEDDDSWVKSMSRYCKEFWVKKGYSEDEATDLAWKETEKNREKMKKKLEIEGNSWFLKTRTTSLEYWTNKGFTEEDAREKLKDRQATFSLEKCIRKYGEEEGRKRWAERQKKWSNSYSHNNFSKISQELFWEIFNRLPEKFKKSKSIFFATLNKEKKKDESGKNNEYRLSLSNSVILPDFLILEDKKIIEFDGNYWHGQSKNDRRWNVKREERRDNLIIENNFSVYHVQEKKYILNKEQIIHDCLKFINE